MKNNTYPTECPVCGSAHFIKRGKDTRGRIRYSCNKCAKNFTQEGWERSATRPLRLALAIQAVVQGMGTAKASKTFNVAEYTICESFDPKAKNDDAE